MDDDESNKESSGGLPKATTGLAKDSLGESNAATEQSPRSNNKKTARFTKGVSIDMGSSSPLQHNHQASGILK